MYKIIFQGKLRPGQTPEAVKPRLARLLKTDMETLELLFDGNSWLIKKNLSHDKAQLYVRAFTEVGAGVSLMDNEQEPLNRRFSVEAYPLAPMIYSRPRKLKVNNENNQAFCFISAKKPLFGRGFSLFLPAFPALVLQQWFTRKLVVLLGTGWEVSLLSMLLFFGLWYGVYVSLSSMRHLIFYRRGNDPHSNFLALHLAHGWQLNNLNYHVYTQHQGEQQLLVRLRKKSLYSSLVQVFTPQDALLAEMHKVYNLEQFGMQMGFAIRKELFKSKLLDIIQGWVSGKKRRPGFVITNPQGDVQASCTIDEHHSLNIYPENHLQQEVLLALLALSTGF